jgi:hypothetical protein
MDEGMQRVTLTLRHVSREIVDDLYGAKFITGRPVYDLAEEALGYWLETVMRPYLLQLNSEEEIEPIVFYDGAEAARKAVRTDSTADVEAEGLALPPIQSDMPLEKSGWLTSWRKRLFG